MPMTSPSFLLPSPSWGGTEGGGLTGGGSRGDPHPDPPHKGEGGELSLRDGFRQYPKRLRVDPVFFLQHPRGQRFGGVAGQDGDFGLQDDRS
jgi:hypothetical protein